MTLVLSDYGSSFATRSRARQVLDGAVGELVGRSVVIDASDVYMSPSFIAELLVVLVEEKGHQRVLVRGAREHPAHVAQDLADKFGYADRVEVEQPTVPA